MNWGDTISASKARLRANRRYKQKHRSNALYHSYKSTCKNFILNKSTKDDLDNLIPEWMKVRKQKLNNLK